MSQRKRQRRHWRHAGSMMEESILRLAEELAEGDLDLQDDLAQEGRIAIWHHAEMPGITPQALRRRLRRVAKNGMLKFLNPKPEEQ